MLAQPLPSTVEVRRALDVSPRQLSRDLARCFSGYAVPVTDDAEHLAGRLRREHVDLGRSFELWDQDRLGAVVLVARRGATARIAGMGAPPEARGRGWGRRTLELAVNEARSHGERLVLEVLQDNSAAIRLYESFGFRRQGQLLGHRCPVDAWEGPTGGRADLGVRQVEPAEVAGQMASTGADLSWQLEPATLAGLTHPWCGWAAGKAVAIGRRRGDVIELWALVCGTEDRRQGHARRLLEGMVTHHRRSGGQVREFQIPSLLPQGTAQEFLRRVGFMPVATRQWQMVLEPTSHGI